MSSSWSRANTNTCSNPSTNTVVQGQQLQQMPHNNQLISKIRCCKYNIPAIFQKISLFPFKEIIL